MVNISELRQLQQLPNEVIPAVARNAEEGKVERGSCRRAVSVHQNALLWFCSPELEVAKQRFWPQQAHLLKVVSLIGLFLVISTMAYSSRPGFGTCSHEETGLALKIGKSMDQPVF